MKNILSKILLLSLTTLALTSCFGGDDTSNTDGTIEAGKIVYETSEFAILAPQDWEILEKSTFPSTVPSNTEVGFRNNIKSEIFTANVNINTTAFADTISSKDFAKSTMSEAKSSLLSFQEVESLDHQVAIGDKVVNTVINEFQGKKSAIDPIIRFLQLYVTDNGIAYTVTGAYLPNEDESVVKMIEEMLDSFSLK